MKLVSLTQRPIAANQASYPTFVNAEQIAQITRGSGGVGSDLVTSSGVVVAVVEEPAAVAVAFGYVAP